MPARDGVDEDGPSPPATQGNLTDRNRATKPLPTGHAEPPGRRRHVTVLYVTYLQLRMRSKGE